MNVAHDNTAVLRRVEDNLAHILAHKEFKNVQTLLPLGFDQGGFQQKFDLASFKTSMEATGRYQCGINLFWQNFAHVGHP